MCQLHCCLCRVRKLSDFIKDIFCVLKMNEGLTGLERHECEQLMTELKFLGIVHPKMKILSSFTHPQVVPNLYEFLSSVEYKRRIFWRILVTKQLTVAIDSIAFFSLLSLCYYGSQWLPLTVWWPTFFKICVLPLFKRRKKLIQVWNNNNWNNYPFNKVNTVKYWFQGVSNAIQVHNERGCKCVCIHRARELILFNTSPCPWWWNRDSMLPWQPRPSDERTRRRCSGCQGWPGRARENERGQWSGW